MSLELLSCVQLQQTHACFPGEQSCSVSVRHGCFLLASHDHRGLISSQKPIIASTVKSVSVLCPSSAVMGWLFHLRSQLCQLLGTDEVALKISKE